MVTLFRQEQYWKNNGVELKRNTLVNWIIRSSLWLKPLWQLMKDELFLEIIERLFAIEKGLEGIPEKTISAEREKKSVPLLNEYWKLLENTNALGGSNLYKAVNYSLNHRKELEGYLRKR